MDRVRRFVSVSRLSRWLLFVGEAFIPGSGTAAGEGENNYYCYQTEFGSRHARKFILGTGWRGRHSWRKQAWLLKNSLSRNPQKLDRVRMPYKRFSLVAWTFSIPQICPDF